MIFNAIARSFVAMNKRENAALTKMLRVMKLTAILFFIACIHVSAHGLAQDHVTFAGRDVPLEQVFSAIKKQTSYLFLYNESYMKYARKVTISVKNASIKEVLDECMKDQPFDYNIEGKTIFLVNKPEPVKVKSQTTLGNLIEVKGRVVDESGEPIVGANVTIKGTSQGTATDENGYFSLAVIDENAVILVSSIGYEAHEMRVSGKTTLNISLRKAINSLDETVVIAYGSTTKRLNTGNVTSVKSTEIENQPVSNPLAALEGRVPGMVITQTTGMAGGAFKVQIRGRSSINPQVGNNPLYIIDGVPYTSQSLSNQTGVNGGSPLNFINPSDIESIDVLKDADATAIYGSRGANGVILITTKTAKTGSTKVNFNGYSGIGKVTRTAKLLNTQQYLEMRHEAFHNDAVLPTSANAPDLLVWDTTRYTDWTKELIGGTARFTDGQISFSGGNANTQFLLGGGCHNETTVFPGTFSDKKINAHFNIINTSVNQRFKLSTSGSFLADKNNSLGNGDPTSYISSIAPDAPKIYNADGTLNWANGTWGFNGNPYANLLVKYLGKTYNLISNTLLSYRILNGLDFKLGLGYNNMQYNEILATPIAFNDPSSGINTGSSEFINQSLTSFIAEPQITYEIKIGDGKLTSLVGTTLQSNTNQAHYLFADGITSDALLENSQAATSLRSVDTKSQYKYNAIFGRLNYVFRNKYLLNLTGRRDGSSRFGPGKQFSNFGAIGAGWIFSKENFIQQHFSFLSFGKLRASYGTSGNDQIGDYQFLDLYKNSSYSYQGLVGLYPNNLFNPDFAWEINKKFELGLEVGLIKDRIFISLDYFKNRSTNQLVGYSLPALTGFTSITNNLAAKVENSGIELLVNTSNISTQNFKWSTSFNISIPKNKLVEYPNFSSSSYANTYVIGQPLTISKVYHWLGVNDTTGLYQYSNSKGNPTYSPTTTDRTVIINTAPKYYGGIQNTFEYNGFQLDLLFQFVKQIGSQYLFNILPGSFGNNQPISVLNRWQNSGGGPVNYQMFSQKFTNAFKEYTNAKTSDFIYGDASFIRLKNVSISYQLPKRWKQKAHLQNCRLYVMGQNILTITRYKGNDPENQSPNNLPPLKVLTIGIQIGL